ncbi:MAG: glycosyltransferase family 4 protein, partial [Candidatus Dormibacteraceae bacterium]
RPRVGMVTVAVELTRALLSWGEVGHRFTLLCSDGCPSQLESWSPAIISSPSHHEMFNKLAWLPSVEASLGADLMFYPYWPAPPWRSGKAPKAVVFIHDLAFRIRPDEVPWQQRAYLGWLVPTAVRRAAAILVPSNTTREDLLNFYPRPGLESRLHVVGEGSGLERVRGGQMPAGLKPGFILAVGTIEARKNYHSLLAAHRLLRERGSPPPLVVVGGAGWQPSKVATDLAQDPQVRLLGHVDDETLLTLYRQASLLAFPSLYEGFGLPLLEAMQQGLPAVIGDAGSLPELAAGTAISVEPTDVEAIADGLERVLGDKQLRDRLSQAGRRRGAEFSWQLTALRVIKIMEGLK